MSCEYCDIKKYYDRWNRIKVLNLNEGCYTDLNMVYDGKAKNFRLTAEGEGRAEIKINYCPMCGRRLS